MDTHPPLNIALRTWNNFQRILFFSFKNIPLTWDLFLCNLFLGTVNAERVLFVLPRVCTAINTGTQIHAKENSNSTAHFDLWRHCYHGKKKRIMPILKGCLHWQNEYISIKLSIETDLLIQMKFLSGQGRSETLTWNWMAT